MQTPSYCNDGGLFSTDSLEKWLPETEAWNTLDETELRTSRDEIVALWDRAEGSGDCGSDRWFIRRVLETLSVPFTSDAGRVTDESFRTNAEQAPLIVEATGESFASHRLHTRLHTATIDWAVCTNGRQWRLYHDAMDHRFDAFYEIDLPALLETGSIEAFKLFYLFFRHEAFIEDEHGDCFLDDVYEKSTDVSEELRDELTDNVYEAVPVFAEGLLAHLDDSNVDSSVVRDNTLVYLFRLIVVLYAENDENDWLGSNSEWYRRHGLDGLKRSIARGSEHSETACCKHHDSHWSRLSALFHRIDESWYNGWLFRSDSDEDDRRPETRLLAQSRIDDAVLERVIELLTQRQPDEEETEFIDYSSLSVRHLGSIYEELLEYELHVAEQSLTLVDGEYVSVERTDTDRTCREVEVSEGEAYLTTDSGARKATGSYYTPEHIVVQIVSNCLAPIVADVRAALDGPDSGETFARRVFELAVLDPAMGCGHFLTTAGEYLTRAILVARERNDSETHPHPADIDLIRRQVAKHCLYGVDRDPLAVELGNASLRLWTGTDQPPLLDHHLRTGNALVGCAPETIEQLLGHATTTDEGFEPSRQSGPHSRLRAIANVKTAEEAGFDGPPDAIERMLAAIANDSMWEEIETTDWFQAAQQRADRDQYFHWPLEFPQLYGEEGVSRFDAVVGNPPYVRDRNLDETHKTFHRNRYRTAAGAYDLYGLFVELAADIGNRCSFIIPNKWTTTGYGESLRELLLTDCTLYELVDVSRHAVFPDADVYPLIITYAHDSTGSGTNTFTIRRVEQAASIDGATASVTVSRALIDQLGGVIPIDLTPGFVPVLEKALAQETTLGDHVMMHEGIHTGNVRDELVVADNIDASCEKLVDGTSIRRYHVDWSGEWIRYDDSLVDSAQGEYANLRDRELFDREQKLFVRDISYRPVAAYDDSGLFALNTVYSVTPQPDSELDLKYVLAVFNSTFVDRYFRQVFGGTHVGGDYLRFKPMFTHTIPIPTPNDRALPETRKRRLRAFDPDIQTRSVVQTLAQLTDIIRDATETEHGMNPTPADLLDGPQQTLSRVTGYRIHEAASDTPLTETADTLEGLRLGSVDIEADKDSLTVLVTARYKPDGDVDATDQWGYTETKPHPAIEFVGPSDTEQFLIREMVQYAVKQGKGTAGFRARATQTKSIVDRLGAITIPVVEDDNNKTQSVPTSSQNSKNSDNTGISDSSDRLNRYRAQLRRMDQLSDRIRTADRFIDEIVYDLYGLTAEEKRTVEQLPD